MTNKPIFFDATGRSAARLSIFGWTAAVVSTVLGIAFIASLVVAPQMEQRELHQPSDRHSSARTGKEGDRSRAAQIRGQAGGRSARGSGQADRAIAPAAPEDRARAACVPTGLKPQNGRSLSIGFYETMRTSSYPALKRAIGASRLGRPQLAGPARAGHEACPAVDRRVINLVRSEPAGRGDRSDDPEHRERRSGTATDLASLAERSGAADALLNQIVAFMSAHHFPALAIDFEQVPKAAHEGLKTFLVRDVGGVRAAWLDHRAGRAVRRRHLALRGLRQHRRLHDADGLRRARRRRRAGQHRGPELVRAEPCQAHARARSAIDDHRHRQLRL